MPRPETDQGILPSILDRLIDPESGGTAALRGYNIRQMVDAVRRDLEDLLNTRQSHQGLPDEFEQVRDSIVTYGLPDFSSVNVQRSNQVARMGELIEEIVGRFEPRLGSVRAVLVVPEDGEEKEGQRVRFYIEAVLRVDPNPDVAFETVVELASGHTQIREREVAP